MSYTLTQLHDMLLEENEVVVLELLDITAEELLVTYKYKIRQRHGFISKYYEESGEEEEVSSRSEEREDRPRGLGSRSAWEDAGFEQDDRDQH